MPLALLAAMPPIIAASMLAGSGPILRPSGARRRFAAEPMTPGCRWMTAASADTRMPCQLSPNNTSTESLSACPDRLVPAARKVSGALNSAHKASKRCISDSSSTTTTSCGTRR